MRGKISSLKKPQDQPRRKRIAAKGAWKDVEAEPEFKKAIKTKSAKNKTAIFKNIINLLRINKAMALAKIINKPNSIYRGYMQLLEE